MIAPDFSKVLRHEAKFSADWAISGMSATFFNWTVLHKSDVIELIADSEDTYENDAYIVREQLFRFFVVWKVWIVLMLIKKNVFFNSGLLSTLRELLHVGVYNFFLAVKKAEVIEVKVTIFIHLLQ